MKTLSVIAAIMLGDVVIGFGLIADWFWWLK